MVVWVYSSTSSEGQKEAQKVFGDRMAEFIKDPRLLKGFTPKFAIGCRRITPGKAKSFSKTRRLGTDCTRRSIHESHSRTER